VCRSLSPLPARTTRLVVRSISLTLSSNTPSVAGQLRREASPLANRNSFSSQPRGR
jgi:hypothetical protein